ncbi:MAG: DUF3048 domain-containing protein [Lachnospiraceae bacterium]|nr:DUF3048 domain-containing protein [Lachnospiraceae bacterium]
MTRKKLFAGIALSAMMLAGTVIGGYAEEAEQTAAAEETVAEEAVAEDAAAEEAVAEEAAETGAAAEESTDSDSNEMVRSFLTGKLVPASIGRARPIAVMLNNIADALPQSGISNAEIVYEAPVEGAITRLLGIFEDYQDIERIGSVRSCREYYVYFAREFEATYLHYGEAVYATGLLNMSDTIRLSGMGDYDLQYDGEGDVVYYRSDDFVTPHNVFTNYDMIQAGLEYKGYSTEYSDEYLESGHYQFASDDEVVTLDAGEDALVVKPGYAYNYPEFVYDSETGKYTRYQLGDVQIDYYTQKALTYDNIILQYCSWVKWDDNGYLDIDVYSGGSGKYITRGKAIDITWTKDDADSSDRYADGNFGVTHYYDSDGNEITLNQGKTWVCIILDTEADAITIEGTTAE